jgi:hypothetical protein
VLEVLNTHQEAHYCLLVGRPCRFLSNPDLVRRIKLGAPLTKYNRDTFYTQGGPSPDGKIPGIKIPDMGDETARYYQRWLL